MNRLTPHSHVEAYSRPACRRVVDAARVGGQPWITLAVDVHKKDSQLCILTDDGPVSLGRRGTSDKGLPQKRSVLCRSKTRSAKA